MKLIVRVFVLALVATGAVASNHIAHASQPTISGKASFMPVPMCPPNGSTDCGMCQLGGNCGSKGY